MVYVLTQQRGSHLPTGAELCRGRLNSSGACLGGDLTCLINSFPFFSLLFLTPFPMLLLSPIKDIIKLSFLGQCKCEALLAICIKPHKPHQCTPALWSLSSESLGWGQSHFTSSNSVSECQIELKLEASPLKRKAQSLCSELQSKTQPHTQTTIPH